MNFKYLIIILSLFLSFQMLYALSCAPTIQTIGTISNINQTSYGFDIFLDEEKYSYNSEKMFNYNTSQIDLNSYKFLINDFQKNKFDSYGIKKLTAQEVEYNFWSNSKSIPFNYSKLNLSISQGDIFVSGPPFFICDYGFNAIFSSNGNLKYVFVNSDYTGFKYENISIQILEGKNLKYCSSNICKTNVIINDLSLNNQIELNPNQSYKLNDFNTSLILFDASNYNSNFEYEYFDWGFGKYARYMILFNESKTIEVYQDDKKNSLIEKFKLFLRSLF